MASTRPDHRRDQTRTYDRSSSVVFLKTKEEFGGLSNMAGGFPLLVNGVRIRTSEALYQACRFPHLPDVQGLIIAQRSPMTAKMKGKPYRHDSRQDWNRVRVNVMRWCLRVKLAQNWEFFSKLLLDTGDRAIVEQSHKDDFWGARPVDDRTLVGMNVLGRLLMELRESVKTEPGDNFLRVDPLHITDFRLGGRPIEPVTAGTLEHVESVDDPPAHSPRLPVPEPVGIQLPPTRPPKVAVRVLREDSNAYAANQGGGNLKPYPAYKDSGVEWLGEVPQHWEVRTLAQIGKLSKGGGGNKDDEVSAGVPCVRYGDLYTTHDYFIRKSRSFVSKEKAFEYTATKLGDVLFAGSGETIDEIGKSAVNLMQAEACCGGDVIVFRPARQVEARYLGYATDCRPAAIQKATMGRGITVMHIYGTRLKQLTLPLPPLSEQTAIARFLDHADRRILHYIRARQKLIARLEEQKQAIIHQAVTGQIDVRTGRPYPAYKPSGVEWLGDVPEHWTVARLKFVATDIVDCLHETPRYLENGEFPAIRTADIVPGAVRLLTARRIEWAEYVRWIERLEPLPGDILYSREGERFGIAACVPEGARLCISQRMMLFRIRPEHNPLFVMWMLNSEPVLAQARQCVMGATAPHVNVSTIRNYTLALPPRSVQDSLVEIIERSTRDLNGVIVSAERSTSFLREYRTRLIADVVTGKLDVRQAAAGLPEVVQLAENEDSDPGSIPEAGLHSDQFGVTHQEAEA